jgi:ribosome assembly protein 1
VELSVSDDALGKMYTVLAKRRGRVLSEDMKDGVNLVNVEAIQPLTKSFGFAEALRKQTSGFASAQMLFSHWEVVDVDPFWSPRTEEELEDIAIEDNTDAKNNLARKLVTAVRKRKGLRLEEKIVQNAEKQRTLSRKK